MVNDAQNAVMYQLTSSAITYNKSRLLGPWRFPARYDSVSTTRSSSQRRSGTIPVSWWQTSDCLPCFLRSRFRRLAFLPDDRRRGMRVNVERPWFFRSCRRHRGSWDAVRRDLDSAWGRWLADRRPNPTDLPALVRHRL